MPIASLLPVVLVLLSLPHSPTPKKNQPPLDAIFWSDEFDEAHDHQTAPDPKVWGYVTGPHADSGGDQVYCGYESSAAPCDTAHPNSFVGTDGNLHIVVQKGADGSYTSAFLQTKGLKSFRYGRIEARMKLSAGQGMWPAFWLMGDKMSQVSWPKCGELDVMESLGRLPQQVFATIHAAGYAQPGKGKQWELQGKKPLSAGFHTFGMIWRPKSIEFYVDDPSKPYATFTPDTLASGEEWPFDSDKFFLLVNTAVGGDWSGRPDATTKTPAEMLVDYVRVYRVPETTQE